MEVKMCLARLLAILLLAIAGASPTRAQIPYGGAPNTLTPGGAATGWTAGCGYIGVGAGGTWTCSAGTSSLLIGTIITGSTSGQVLIVSAGALGQEAALTAAQMLPLPSAEIYVGSALGQAAALLMSGDCTLTNAGVITCTKIGGVAIALGGSFTTTGVGAVTLAFPSAAATFTFPAASKTLMASDFSNASYTPAHSGANSDITGLTGLTTPLSAAQGGTGINNGSFTLTLGASTSLPAAPASTQCLHESSAGAITATGSDCGAGGSVSVTAGTPNIVINPSPGTSTFTVGTTAALNTQSGNAAYAITSTDAAKIVNRTNTVTQTDTLPATPLASGTALDYETGTVGNTLTPASGTIGGLSSLKVGAQQDSSLVSDGTNYHVALGVPPPPSQGGTTYLRDDMTWATPAGGSGSFAIMGGSGPAAPSNSATTYCTLAGLPTNSGNAAACNTTEPPNYEIVGAARTMGAISGVTGSGFYVRMESAPGVGTSYAFTLRVNGATPASSPTCTISGAASTCNDTTHSASLTAGETADLMVVPTGTPGTALTQWAIDAQ